MGKNMARNIFPKGRRKMKTLYIACIVLLCVALTGFCGYAKEKTLTVADLNQSAVIGSLGKPLGTLVTVEGVVVGDDYRRLKSDEGETLLKIERVDGKILSKEVILHLYIAPFAAIKKPGAGRHFKYAGYETGSFTGIPEEAFKIIPRIATAGFQFEVYFQALKEEK